MAELMRVDADASRLIAALDKMTDTMQARYLEPACLVTANRVAGEARRRVARGETGKTLAGIQVEKARKGTGYVVVTKRQDMYNLPIWLEFSTKHMTARPYFFVAARLEEDAHDRRIRGAIQDAIDASGLGS